MADLNLSSVRLPPAFQECEYIESHGTEWISTHFYLSTGNEIIECDFEYTSLPVSNKDYFALGIRRQVDDPSGTWVEIYSGDPAKWYVRFGSDVSVNVEVQAPVLGRKKIVLKKNYFSVNGVKILSPNYIGSFPNLALTIFGRLSNDASSFNSSNLRCYGVKLYSDASALSKDFIPCYLKTAWNGIPAGTIGMYDLCGSLSSNGTPFYTNGGTGTFAKGPDVIHADAITISGAEVDRLTDANGTAWTKHGLMLPPAFQRCEWIKTSADAYIDTGIFPTMMTRFKVKAKQYSLLYSLFGAVGYNTSGDFQFAVQDQQYGYDRFRFDANKAGGTFYTYSVTKTDPYEFEVNNGVAYYNGHKVGTYSMSDLRTSEYSGLLFANRGSSGQVTNARGSGGIYFVEIDQGNDKRNYIPCYLKTAWNGIPAGTIGLYDLCGSLSSNGTPFYVNEGTGEFTKGADVV